MDEIVPTLKEMLDIQKPYDPNDWFDKILTNDKVIIPPKRTFQEAIRHFNNQIMRHPSKR